MAQELTPEIKGDSIIYHLTIDETTINLTGKNRTAMTINGGIPGPTLRFKEGKHAVIHVTNKLNEETSVHWHGLLLPNFMDGVPYLTTPPIRPGKTFTYDFPLIHSGTYWFHSHTGLQEQLGVYGSIIIDPAEKELQYDHDLVLLLSDWTDQKPMNVLRNLKRHNEWYAVEIGNAPSIIGAMKTGALNSQFKLWSMNMPGMHISDIPYDAFLINGKENIQYDDYKPGDVLRIRVINAAASTYFWLTTGQGKLDIISADGMDVKPVTTDKVLIALAQTYDFLFTVPDNQSIEFRATAQDVTGSASAFIGSGTKVNATEIPKPDYYQLAINMSQMHGGDHSMELEANEHGSVEVIPNTTHKVMSGSMSDMDHGSEMGNEEHQMNHEAHMAAGMHHSDESDSSEMNTADSMNMDHGSHDMEGSVTDPMMMWDSGYSNTILRSKESSEIQEGDSVRSLVLNLTGNMWRYIWSINGKTLSESDKIKIKKGEVVRITLNNTTMMHHPMHLHGHFFRVLNGNGEYSPVKHTVDVPPMSRITIEFAANEEKDWFFHCHLLYHMKSGMARVISYDGSTRDQRLAPYPVNTLYKMDEHWYSWATVQGSSNMGKFAFTASGTRNEFNILGEIGWNQNYELTADIQHYSGDYTRLFAGINSENEKHDSFEDHDISGRIGIRHLLIYILDTELSIDNKVRPELKLKSHLPILSRLMLNSHFEWQSDFGITESLPANSNYEYEIKYAAGFEYLLNKNFSLNADYDSRFGFGAGLSWKF